MLKKGWTIMVVAEFIAMRNVMALEICKDYNYKTRKKKMRARWNKTEKGRKKGEIQKRQKTSLAVPMRQRKQARKKERKSKRPQGISKSDMRDIKCFPPMLFVPLFPFLSLIYRNSSLTRLFLLDISEQY